MSVEVTVTKVIEKPHPTPTKHSRLEFEYETKVEVDCCGRKDIRTVRGAKCDIELYKPGYYWLE